MNSAFHSQRGSWKLLAICSAIDLEATISQNVQFISQEGNLIRFANCFPKVMTFWQQFLGVPATLSLVSPDRMRVFFDAAPQTPSILECSSSQFFFCASESMSLQVNLLCAFEDPTDGMEEARLLVNVAVNPNLVPNSIHLSH